MISAVRQCFGFGRGGGVGVALVMLLSGCSDSTGLKLRPQDPDLKVGDRLASGGGRDLSSTSAGTPVGTGRWFVECPTLPLVSIWNQEVLRKNGAVRDAVAAQRLRISNDQDRLVMALQQRGDPSAARPFRRHSTLLNAVLLDRPPTSDQRAVIGQAGCRIFEEFKATVLLDQSVPHIGATQVWSMSDMQGSAVRGKNIKIGILDTGIDYKHPDFGGCTDVGFAAGTCRVAGGFNFNLSESEPGFLNPLDDYGHGTHVASIAAGAGSFVGVAPEAKLFAFKVLDSNGVGGTSPIISGMERAADPNGDLDFSDHLDVINMSLGFYGGTPDDSLSRAADQLSDLGVIVVAAAGNAGSSDENGNFRYSSVASPGTARSAITVGASGHDNDTMADFSSKGPVGWAGASGKLVSILKPDVVAPGNWICAARASVFKFAINPDADACPGPNHAALRGTSMAAPHVTGVAALMKQLHPTWAPRQIKQALKNQAVDLHLTPVIQGSGRVDVHASAGLSTPPPVLELQPILCIVKKKPVRIDFEMRGAGLTQYRISYGQGTPNFWNLPTRWKKLKNKPFAVPPGAETVTVSESLDPVAKSLGPGFYWILVEVMDSAGRISKDYGRFTIR